MGLHGLQLLLFPPPWVWVALMACKAQMLSQAQTGAARLAQAGHSPLRTLVLLLSVYQREKPRGKISW